MEAEGEPANRGLGSATGSGGSAPRACDLGGAGGHAHGGGKGRDIPSRVILGTRVSLAVAVGAIALGGLVGTGLGVLAGYRGGWVDALVMRAADAFLAFPSILIALVLAVTVARASASSSRCSG